MVARTDRRCHWRPRKFHQGLIAVLLAFAEGEFTLGQRQSDGATLRQHLEIVCRQTGKIPEEYVFPDCPEQLAYLWQLFLQLSRTRGNTGYGLLPLSLVEIEAWTRLMCCPILPWELQAMLLLDSAYMASQVVAKPT